MEFQKLELTNLSYATLPKRVTIELTNRCNRKCKGCPRHKMTYPLGDMSISLFTRITSQLNDNICIVPFNRGEATLHPQFPELMHKLNRFNTVQLASNGDFLTRTNQKAILENCTFISLSLHEFKLPYQTPWLSFLYDCLGEHVKTQVSILDSLVPQKDKRQWATAWLNHVDQVRIYTEHSLKGFGDMDGSKPTAPCNKPFEDMIVYWDGKVGLCCYDWNNPLYLGDLTKQRISEVWQDTIYQKVRLSHIAGLRRSVPTCRDCDFNPHQIYGEVIQCQ